MNNQEYLAQLRYEISMVSDLTDQRVVKHIADKLDQLQTSPWTLEKQMALEEARRKHIK